MTAWCFCSSSSVTVLPADCTGPLQRLMPSTGELKIIANHAYLHTSYRAAQMQYVQVSSLLITCSTSVLPSNYGTEHVLVFERTKRNLKTFFLAVLHTLVLSISSFLTKTVLFSLSVF